MGILRKPKSAWYYWRKMKNYKPIIIPTKELVSITCDICGETDDNVMESQEYTHIHFVGGYNSVFGDGDEYEIDICQNCLKTLIGNKLRFLGSRI
jgi:hypothetical protein